MNASRETVVGRLRKPARAAVGCLRQPEYVGANQCLPCTVVNVVIATIGGGAVAAVGAVGSRSVARPVWLRGQGVNVVAPSWSGEGLRSRRAQFCAGCAPPGAKLTVLLLLALLVLLVALTIENLSTV
ncbi:hypothetical protein ABNG03_10755 [Halorubrum sp. RMP-47]|uniref:DUF8054 domain-containing protein n=1 Tax=Halorubrum miltondacostae TaxID=3076378 RepID=A0ABD5M631_9EURY